MDKDTWLEDIEQLGFKSELQKLADSPMYPEERTSDDEYTDSELEDQDDEGYIYHSQDGIKMNNNFTAKQKIDILKKKRNLKNKFS
jgi:hypothetical protein